MYDIFCHLCSMKLRISEKTKEKGYTLQLLADQMGISRSTLVNTIQKNNPTLSTLEKIASVLDISVFELFDDYNEVSISTCPHCGKPIKIKIEG